jgi:hypothetical protein
MWYMTTDTRTALHGPYLTRDSATCAAWATLTMERP